MTSNAFKAAEFLGKSIDDELFNINSKGNFEVGKNFQDLNIPVAVYKSLDLQGFDGQSIKLNRLIGNFTSTAAVVLTPTATTGKTVYITGDLYCGNEKVSLDLYYNDGDIFINKFDTEADFKLVQLKSNNVNYFALMYTTLNNTSDESRFNGRVSNEILFDLITDTDVLALAVPISTSSKIFEQLPSAAVPFQQAGVCVLNNGNILVVGGIGYRPYDFVTNQCWMYNWKTKVWKRIADMPEVCIEPSVIPLSGNRALVTSIRVNILGNTRNDTANNAHQYIYNSTLDIWERTVDFTLKSSTAVPEVIFKTIFPDPSMTTAFFSDVVLIDTIYFAIGGNPTTGKSVIYTGALLSDGSLTWQNRSSSVSTGQCWGIHWFAAGKCYIASDGNSCMTSLDGVTWTARTIPGTPAQMYGVASNNSLAVIVGVTGKIATSPDGITWTQRTVPSEVSTAQLFGVVYANNIFVATGSSGTILSSPDGITWTVRSIAGRTDTLRGVTHDGTKFIATGYTVGKTSVIFTSVNGTVWTNLTTSIPGTAHKILYRNGKYLIGCVTAIDGIDNIVFGSSTDLVNWTYTACMPGTTYGHELLPDGRILGATVASKSAMLCVSVPNPFTKDTSVLVKGISGIETSPNKVFLAGGNIVWRVADTALTANLNYWNLAYGNGVYVAVGGAANIAGQISTSTDLKTWTTTLSIPSMMFYSVAYGNGIFVATGMGGALYTSVDGFTWSAQVSTIPTATIFSVTYGSRDGIALFAAVAGTVVITSPDGVTWTQRTSNVTYGLTAITYKKNLFLAGGTNGEIATSVDGINWVASQIPEKSNCAALSYLNGVFIFLGNTGEIYTSPNATTWTKQVSGVNTPLRAITYMNGVYTICGDYNTVHMYSTDLITWKHIPSPSLGSLRHLIIANGVYVAAGPGGTILYAADPYSIYNCMELDLKTGTYTKKSISPILDNSSQSQIAKDANYIYMSFKNGVYRYTISADKWELLPNFPASIANNLVQRSNKNTKMVLSNNKLLVVNINTFNTFIYEYDLTKGLDGTWIIKNTLPGVISTDVMSMVKLVDGRVGILLNTLNDTAQNTELAYAFTAYNHSADILEKTVYDTTVPKNPSPRPFSTPTVFELSADEVFVSGVFWNSLGNDIAFADMMRECYKYTISTDTWTRLADYPNGTSVKLDPVFTQYRTTYGTTYGSGVALNNNEVLVTSGVRLRLTRPDGSSGAFATSADASDEVYIYNKAVNSWTAVAPRATFAQLKGTYGGKLIKTPANEIILIGAVYREAYPSPTSGINGSTNTVYVFNTSTNIWSSWLSLPFESAFAVVIQNKLDPNLVYICAPSKINTSGVYTVSNNVYELNLTTKAVNILGSIPFTANSVKSGFFNSVNNSLVIAQDLGAGSYGLIEFSLETNTFSLAGMLPKDLTTPVDNRVQGPYSQVFDTSSNVQLNFNATFSNNISIIKPNSTQYQGRITRLPSQTQNLSVNGSSALSKVRDTDTAIVVGGYTGRGLDTDTFIQRTTSTTNGIYGIAYGAGLFVAVGDTGTILTSPDGITWTARASGTTLNLRSIVFANGVFIIVGYAHVILTSSTGITWASRTNTLVADTGAIAYGAGSFVAVDSTGVPATSPDGITWTTRTATNTGTQGLAYGAGLFVTVGLTNASATSPDGITWTARVPGFAVSMAAVVFVNSLFVAVGASGAIYTSTNGISWSARSSGTTDTLYRATYINGLYVVAGANGTIVTSPDGITWTIKVTGLTNTVFAILNTNEITVVGGMSGYISSGRNINYGISSINLRNGRVSKITQLPNNLELYNTDIVNIGDDRFLITGRKGYQAIDTETVLTDGAVNPVLIYDYLENSFTVKSNMPWVGNNRTKGVFVGSKSFVENGLVYSVKSTNASTTLAITTYNPATDTWAKLIESSVGWYDSLSYVGNFSIGRVFIATRASNNSFEFYKFNTSTNQLTSISSVITGRPNHLGAIKTDDNTIVIPFFVNSADSYKPYSYYYKYDILNNIGNNINYSAEELLLLPTTFGDSMYCETDSDGSTYFFGFSQWSANTFSRCATDIVALT